MTVSGKDKRGLVEELRTLRTRLDRLERQNAELVQAEKELRKSLGQFKTMFEDSPLGLYRTTPDGRILMANSTLVNMLDYSSFEELARRNLESEGYHPQYPRSLFKERIEREGTVIGLESAWKRFDGTTVHIRESAQAVRDETGNTLYYQGTVEDITERKLAEEALRRVHGELETRVQERTAELQQANEVLRERELSLKLALQVAQLGHWDWHIPSGKIVCSDEIYRMFGVQPDQFESTYEHFLEFIHPSDLEFVRTEIQFSLFENKLLDVEFRILTPDGRERTVRCQAALFKSQNDEPIRMIGTTQDITERKEAERQILERARIIDSTTDSVIKTDQNGIVIMWNRGAERIFGYTCQEMVGRPVSTLYSEQEQGRLAEIIEILLKGEEIATAEVTCMHKDGSPVELALSLLPFKDDCGNVTEFVGISKDVTERKRIQDALHQSENRYRTVIENAGEGIVVVQDGMLRFVNSRYTVVTGRSEKESMSRPFIEFVHPDDRKLVWEIHTARLKGEPIPQVYEFRIIDGEGQTRWLENNGVVIEWDGRPASLNFLRDVTSRKNAEEALREREEMIRALVETSRDWIWSIDVHGVHTYCNPAVEQILGYRADELVGKCSFDLIHDDDRKMVEANLPTWIAEKRGWKNLLLRWQHKDGTYRYLESNAVPILNFENELVGFRGVDRDVTERRQAEKTLRETTALLETIFSHTHILVAYLDPQFNFVRVNRAYAQADGREPSFFVGRNHIDLYPNAENEAIFRKVVSIGVPYFAHAKSFEYAGHPEHPATYWDWSLVPIKQQDGVVCGLVLTLVNVTQQKKAEQALRESEERFRKVFEEGSIGMVLTSRDLKFFHANPAFCKMLGYTVEEMSHKTFLDVTHPAHRDADRQNVEKMWRGEVQRYTTEKRYLTKQGDTRWGSLTTSLIQGQGGKPLYAIAIVEDITERKLAEEALRESEARYRAIFQTAMDGFWRFDMQGRLLEVNETYCRMSGYSQQELLTMSISDLEAAERPADTAAHIRKIVAQSQDLFESRHRRKDGTIFEVEVNTQYRPGEGGWFIAFSRDITERKRAEEALRKSEERFRQFFENEPEYCYMVSPEGTFLDVNAAALKALGRTKKELLGQPLQLIYAPESLSKITALFEKWKLGESIKNEELVILAKDGTQRTVLLSAGFVQDSSGRIVHSILVQRDITELKRAERALREREATLTSIFRTAPIGIGLERDHVLARVNDQVCSMLGYSREELVGQCAVVFYPTEDDYERVRRENRPQILEKGTATVETRWKRKDGRIIDVLLNTTFFDTADFTKGVTFTALDITERKAAEETLRESEEKFRSLAEQSPNMIFINKKGRVVYANRKCEEIMGYTREEFSSPDFNFLSLFEPGSVDVVKKNFARHLSGQEVEPYEYCLIGKAGQRIEAINASKLIQYEGETAILGVVTDITERKKAEQTLRESQERLSILFELAPDAIYLMDLEGRFVDGNKAAEELVGFTKAELIGKNLAESKLLSDEDLSRATMNLRKTAAGQSPEPTEYTIRKKCGSLIAVEIRTFPVRIGGKILSLGIARDVTTRKHTEDAIRASEKKFRSIFETAANLITSVDEQGIIVDCNDRVQEFLGYEKGEILGRPMSKVIHPDYLGKAQTALKEILNRGFSYNKEHKMVRKDGSLIDVNINSSAIEDEHGKYTRTLCIIDDITERKQAQQKLLDDREQLKSLASQLSLTEERERRRLATVLHDHIGQSLVFSKIKLDQMRKSGSAGELTEALKDVSRHLEQVIQDMRTLTFDLSDPILYELGLEAAVAEWLTEHVQEKHGIETEFHDDGQAKPLDDDIRALLFRNVRELLTNVVKHARAQRVKVTAGKADKYICVSVQDDGVGFDPVEAAATAFKKAEFGLFSIRERLEQLGGHVKIESKFGRGTKITMTAPLKYERANDGIEKR